MNVRSIARFISGRQPKEVREERDRELRELKSKIADGIQSVQSGNRILQNMSGVIELNRR